MDEGYAARVAGNVRSELARYQLRGADVAAALGMANQTFSARRSGRQEWRLSELEALADVIGVPLTFLVIGRREVQELREPAGPLDLAGLEGLVVKLEEHSSLAADLVGRARVELERLRA